MLLTSPPIPSPSLTHSPTFPTHIPPSSPPPPSRFPPPPPTNLITDLALLSVAESTYHSYRSNFNSYVSFCSLHNLPPLSHTSLHQFIFHCFQHKDSYGKANNTTSAIIFWCKQNNIPPPTTPLTSLGLKAYRRIYLLQKPPLWVPVEHLHALEAAFNPLQLEHYCFLTLSFWSLVRPKEILHLKWHHVFLSKAYMWMPWSKTDQEGRGTYVTLLPPALRCLSLLCISKAHTQNDPVFLLDQCSLNPWLESKCAALNLPKYNWYALKHGDATQLALLGWPLRKIQQHGRWKTKESARRYIHAPVLL